MFIFWLTSLFVMPGIVMHEVSHKFFCDWAGVRVREVCYFRFGNPAGYVVHDSPEKFSQILFIAVGPLILGTFFSFLFVLLFREHFGQAVGIFFAWLGFVIAANSFPSTGDAKALLSETTGHVLRNPFALVGFPIVLAIWIINKLNVIYLNYIYALAVFWFVFFYLR